MPGFDDQIAPTSAVEVPIPADGVLRDLTVLFNVPFTPPPPATVETLSFTVYLNGVATALAVTGVAVTQATAVQNTIDTVDVVAGDEIAIAVDKTGSLGAQDPREIVATLRWT